MVAHPFNPSTWEAEAGRFLSSEASLVYRMSSRTSRATQRNPVLKKQKEKKRERERLRLSQRKNMYLKMHSSEIEWYQETHRGEL